MGAESLSSTPAKYSLLFLFIWWRIYEVLVDISAALFSLYLNFIYERDFSFLKLGVFVEFVRDVNKILNFPRAKFTRVKHEQNTIDVETLNTYVYITTTCILEPLDYIRQPEQNDHN